LGNLQMLGSLAEVLKLGGADERAQMT